MLLGFHLFEKVMDTMATGIIGLWAFIDGIVYRLVSVFFKLFYALAEVQLLDNSIYRAIADRVYLFIGIIALFALTVALLKALVNPDELNKSVIKSFKSLVTSIILVVLTPSIFTYAFSFQAAILQDNLIGKIFQIDLNEYKEKGENKIVDSDESMSSYCKIDSSIDFSTEGIAVIDSQGNNIVPEDIITQNECEGNYVTMTILESFFTPYSNEIENEYGTKWKDAKRYMVYTGNFSYITTFKKNAHDAEENQSVSYSIIVSTIAGGFLIYLLLSFCIDLGVRSAKLAFYQLVAPLPILLKLIPGKEGQFDKWLKSTISTFLEVFVRLIVIEFAMFMCSNLWAIIDSLEGFSTVNLLGKAILALGLLAFAKQAPKLLKDALGIEGGNLKLGIKGKLHDIPIAGKVTDAMYSGANKLKGAATGALGGGWTGAVNGVGFKTGAVIGASKGFKTGGSQFNNQRQKVYEAIGGKKQAGLFGGKTFIDEKADALEKAARASFREQFRDSNEYQDLFNRILETQRKALEENVANAQRAYDANIESQTSERQNAINAAQGKYNDAINTKKFIDDSIKEFRQSDVYRTLAKGAYAQERVAKMIESGEINGKDSQAVANAIKSIENKFVDDRLKAAASTGQADSKVMDYVKNLDKSIEVQNKIAEAKNELEKSKSIKIDHELADISSGLSKAKSVEIDTSTIQKMVDEEYRTGKPTSNAGKAFKNEMQTEYLKEYREKNAEQIELYKEAMKKMTSDDAGKISNPSSPPPSDSDKK